MRRRGFALLAVLWLVATLSGLLVTWNATFRTGERASRNRILLERSRWAAEACLAIAEGRWSTDSIRRGASEALGRGTWCRWAYDDPRERLNVNAATGAQLAALALAHGLSVDSAATFARWVLARRGRHPLALEQLAALPGFRPPMADDLTVDGDGLVSASAGARVLGTLPGLTAEAIALLRRRTEERRPVGSLDELLGSVSPASRTAMLERYRDLQALLAFGSDRTTITATGWATPVPGSLVATIELAVTLHRDGFTIHRRRTW